MRALRDDVVARKHFYGASPKRLLLALGCLPPEQKESEGIAPTQSLLAGERTDGFRQLQPIAATLDWQKQRKLWH
jgi:hypothetical protein